LFTIFKQVRLEQNGAMIALGNGDTSMERFTPFIPQAKHSSNP